MCQFDLLYIYRNGQVNSLATNTTLVARLFSKKLAHGIEFLLIWMHFVLNYILVLMHYVRPKKRRLIVTFYDGRSAEASHCRCIINVVARIHLRQLHPYQKHTAPNSSDNSDLLVFTQRRLITLFHSAQHMATYDTISA